MFGTKADLNNPINHGELEGIKLFASLYQLDKQIESWKRIYIQGVPENCLRSDVLTLTFKPFIYV